jgi:hypothetical protein
MPDVCSNTFSRAKDLWPTFALVNALLIGASRAAAVVDTSERGRHFRLWYGMLWGACLAVNIQALFPSVIGLARRWVATDGETLINKSESCLVLGVSTVLGALLFTTASLDTCFGFSGKSLESLQLRAVRQSLANWRGCCVMV